MTLLYNLRASERALWELYTMPHTVVIKLPGEEAQVRQVQACDYQFMKGFIGGYLEHLGFSGLDFWMDEEGKLKKLPANIVLPWGDVVAGPLLITSANEEGDAIGLTEDQVVRATRLLKSLDYGPRDPTCQEKNGDS